MLALLFLACPDARAGSDAEPFRPPAVPLVACDPYFSIWSMSDTLSGDVTRHWTGRAHPLTSLVRIDGKTFRLMGKDPEDLPALPQTSVEVLPTRSVYTFEGAGIRLVMTFMQPALPENLDWISSPVVLLNWDCTATGQRPHEVAVYLDAGMDLVVHQPDQKVVWNREEVEGLHVLRAGSEQQNILGRSGDNVRIDWGHFHLAAPESQKPQSTIAAAEDCRKRFMEAGPLPAMDSGMPRAVRDGAPVMALQWKLETLRPGGQRSCRAILAYDDIKSILYFGKRLEAFWKRNGRTIGQLLTESDRDFGKIAARCREFDRELTADLEKAGGRDYRLLGSLAYRQAMGANKIVDDGTGRPLMFSKETFSGGCMATVDVFYPFAPQVLLLSPALAKASFVPILEYARSGRWKFPFAPHDLGRYPHAMGQAYGGKEKSAARQMPVEESGNMILLVAAVVQAENDISFAREYWDLLTTWAKYLTWSQKYNLVWDRLLDLNLFPPSVAEKEMAHYRKIQNTYGLPLDNRAKFTKLDWIVWSASITGKQEDFKALVAPVIAFLNATPDRVPMTDWYFTDSARQRLMVKKKHGFQARPVVGGVFIRLMDDDAVWKKWVTRTASVSGTWSPLPDPPRKTKLVSRWACTFTQPAGNWFQPDFNAPAHGWKSGKGGFGTRKTPGFKPATQ